MRLNWSRSDGVKFITLPGVEWVTALVIGKVASDPPWSTFWHPGTSTDETSRARLSTSGNNTSTTDETRRPRSSTSGDNHSTTDDARQRQLHYRRDEAAKIIDERRQPLNSGESTSGIDQPAIQGTDQRRQRCDKSDDIYWRGNRLHFTADRLGQAGAAARKSSRGSNLAIFCKETEFASYSPSRRSTPFYCKQARPGGSCCPKILPGK